MKTDLQKQLDFILEIDKLKQIERRSYLINEPRLENSAEHSWHVTIAALLLAPPSKGLDVFRILKMLLIHDIVEIDAGDTFLYDESGNEEKAKKEQKAANRLFNLLPENQAIELRQLWDEFEARQTPEAKYARGLDRFMPLLHNYYTKGKTWHEHGITEDKVYKHNHIISDAFSELWHEAQTLISSAVAKNFLSPAPKSNYHDSRD